MTKERLTRTSVFLARGQVERMRQLSQESGVPLAAMIRRGVNLYLGGVTTAVLPNPGRRVEQAEINAAEPVSAAAPSSSIVP